MSPAAAVLALALLPRPSAAQGDPRRSQADRLCAEGAKLVEPQKKEDQLFTEAKGRAERAKAEVGRLKPQVERYRNQERTKEGEVQRVTSEVNPRLLKDENEARQINASAVPAVNVAGIPDMQQAVADFRQWVEQHGQRVRSFLSTVRGLLTSPYGAVPQLFCPPPRPIQINVPGNIPPQAEAAMREARQAAAQAYARNANELQASCQEMSRFYSQAVGRLQGAKREAEAAKLQLRSLEPQLDRADKELREQGQVRDRHMREAQRLSGKIKELNRQAGDLMRKADYCKNPTKDYSAEVARLRQRAQALIGRVRKVMSK